MSPRWWNEGRYARECDEFDAAQPMSRRIWESLQRQGRERQIDEAIRMTHERIVADPPFDRDGFINAVTEGGLAIQVKLHINFPLHCGVAYL